MTNPIDDIRKKIDLIDQRIHDLLMERAGHVLEIGAAKKAAGAQMIQPDREAAVIRKIMDRHKGPLQDVAIVRVWRELISAVSILQTDLKVVAYIPESRGHEYVDMVRDYFGSVVSLQYVTNPLQAISMVRDGDCTFAVLPWPENEEENPWWSYLRGDDQTKSMNIQIRLPYIERADHRGHAQIRALAVGRMGFRPSGDDHSFIIMDIDHGISRARILDKLKAAGLHAVGIYSRRTHLQMERTVHMVEIDSYIANDDPRMKEILENLECPEGVCASLGGYPVIRRVLGNGEKYAV